MTLYHGRWGAEEGYKRQERWLEIENFSGRSVLVMQQDVRAKILALNLASMAQGLATRRHAARKHPYQVGWTSSLSAMKDTRVRLPIGALVAAGALLTQTILGLSDAVEAVRPYRQFPRCNPGKLKPRFHPAYCRTA
ncbi:hypothetical protein [Thiorhodococcus mannitoliphagus]|nr:hypothetical protein [Thiorhodococcus mannitoliphagus]